MRSFPAVTRRPLREPKAREVAEPVEVTTSEVPSARRQIVCRRSGEPGEIQSKETMRRSFFARREGAATSLMRVTRRVSPGSERDGLGVRLPEEPPFIRVLSSKLDADSRQPRLRDLNSGAMAPGAKRGREVVGAGSASEILPVS